jgi:spoIIIJ-associated protein
VEWIVTTGRTVEEAKESALDQLGVAEDEAEFEVVEEPKPGLFGRLRREAQIRARVRPVQPRPKVDRRRGERSRRGRKDRSPSSEASGTSQEDADTDTDADTTPSEPSAGSGDQKTEAPARAEAAPTGEAGPRARRSSSGRSGAKRSTTEADALKGAPMSDTAIPLAEHADRVQSFMTGLLEAFDLEADLSVVEMDDETAEVQLEGEDLGILIGRGGATLQAVQTLARSAVQRQNVTYEGRVFIEVSGYRQRRKEALEKFTLDVIEQVRSSGNEVELEPMGSADRKVVHDTANDAGGVRTSSVGDEPRRRVVISPDD